MTITKKTKYIKNTWDKKIRIQLIKITNSSKKSRSNNMFKTSQNEVKILKMVKKV
jgi:hypothetical protein